uniref:Glycerate kinase n=1 Tax=Phlebotomus papatasi TaxID=29031 RepID=A0A1B0DHZ9_PHLPP
MCREEDRLFVEISPVIDKRLPHRVDITDKRCHVVGFGKAVFGMAIEVERILDTHLKSGILSVPCGTLDKFKNTDTQLNSNGRIEVFEGAKNNLPDKDAHSTAIKIKDFVSRLSNDDVLFVLISGGGSALLPLPDPSVTLEQKMLVVKMLARSGATINELNTVRIAISSIKGGKLTVAAENAHKIVSLVISDIVGDPIDLIASGPTYISGMNYQKSANDIIDKYGLRGQLPKAVDDLLAKLTPKEEMKITNNHLAIIANNSIAVNTALQEAEKLGYHAVCLSKVIECDVQRLSEIYLKLVIVLKDYMTLGNEEDLKTKLKEILDDLKYEVGFIDQILEVLKARTKSGICIVAGGETTVEVKGSGIGGRNQELTLRVLKKVLDQDHSFDFGDVGFLSAGTDGIDGPTPAAGAVGTLSTFRQYSDSSLQAYLSTNDSYTFWNKTCPRGHIVIGHTGTNVMDLHVLLLPFS